MMIFVTRVVGSVKATMAVPETKIDAIHHCETQITIYFRDGDFKASEKDNYAVEVQKKVSITYETQENAVAELKNFYKALMKNANAFCFAGET